jgi:hypothetical protein
MSSVSASVSSGTGNIKASFTALATYLSGFVASWQSGLQPMVTATSSTMDSIIRTINGFKPQFSSAGKSLANELSDGLKSGQNGFKGAFNDALDKAVSSARSYHDDFHSAGSYLVSGFSSGIRDNIDKAAAASAAMAKASSDAAKKNLDINSPSRVFRKFGNFVGMGFVLGQQDQMANVAKASTKLTDSAIDAVTSSLSAMNSMDFNDAMKVSPTITPVLDLSNAQRGMNGFLTQGNSITSSLNANIGDITYRNPEAQAMSDYHDAITQSNNDVAASIASLRSDMGEYTNAVKNQETILQIDSKTVAKATAKPMNQEMGTLSRRGSLG